MEVILLIILVWSIISWHIRNKPKRYKHPVTHTITKHSVRRGVFFYKGTPSTTDVSTITTIEPPIIGDMFMSAKAKLEHLNSPYWVQLKLNRLALANNQCEICGSTSFLQLHHTSYIRLGCEKLSDVIILCGGINGCHQRQHDHYGYDRTTNYSVLVKPKQAE